MATYVFEAEFIPGERPGELGSYLIPRGPDIEHDQARIEAIHEAHGNSDTSWSCCETGPVITFHGDGPPLTPYKQFTYTDVELVILEAIHAAQNAAHDAGLTRVYTLEEIEELDRRSREEQDPS